MTTVYSDLAIAMIDYIASVHGGYDAESMIDDGFAIAMILEHDTALAMSAFVTLCAACALDRPIVITEARRVLHSLSHDYIGR